MDTWSFCNGLTTRSFWRLINVTKFAQNYWKFLYDVSGQTVINCAMLHECNLRGNIRTIKLLFKSLSLWSVTSLYMKYKIVRFANFRQAKWITIRHRNYKNDCNESKEWQTKRDVLIKNVRVLSNSMMNIIFTNSLSLCKFLKDKTLHE